MIVHIDTRFECADQLADRLAQDCAFAEVKPTEQTQAFLRSNLLPRHKAAPA